MRCCRATCRCRCGGPQKPGVKITVTFGQQEKTAETGKDGRWLVRLDAMKTSAEPASITRMACPRLVSALTNGTDRINEMKTNGKKETIT